MPAEINLALFINHLKAAVAVVSARGDFLHKNSRFDDLFDRSNESADKNLAELFKNNPPILSAVKKVTTLNSNYILRQAPLVFCDGTEAPMDVEVFSILDNEVEPGAIGLVFHEISHSLAFEEHQRRIDRVHYLATIASGLAHEIKNPLSGIKGASQLLAKSLNDQQEMRALAEIIQKEVVRVDNLVNELLHFTKPKSLNKRTANINQIIHDIVLLQKTVKGADIVYEEDYDPSLPTINVDTDALAQVFLNLIKNARQAIAKIGFIKIRSRIMTDYVFRQGDKTRQVIGVEILDSGQGISAKQLGQIFVPFYTTKVSGSGLGLAVCYQIIEEHEGHIRVKSEVGKGTMFSIYLPI